MKRSWIVRLCLIAFLLTLALQHITLRQVAGAAEAAIPTYGAPAYLNGSSIGGGDGYLGTIDPNQASYVVDTAAELKAALAAASSGQIVYVADGAVITLDSTSDWYGMVKYMGSNYAGFYVKAGVILAGGRGRVSNPGIIRLAAGFYNGTDSLGFIVCGAGADVCGLDIDGPQDGTSGGNYWAAIEASSSSEIYNNEIHGFGYAGVLVWRNANGVWIHHNYIHNIQQDGLGYGVCVTASDIYNTASATVEGNIFDYHRHVIAGSTGRTSYIFRYNYLGANCTSHQIDCHGQNDGYYQEDGGEYVYCAGENIEVYNNTSVCTSAAFVVIRGVPYSTGLVSVHNNWTYLPEDYVDWGGSGWGYEPVIGQIMYSMSGYNSPNQGAFVRMEAFDNWYGNAAPPSSSVNQPPATPEAASGPTSGEVGTSYTCSVETTDPDGNSVAYTIYWGDGTSSTTEQVSSGATATASHTWTQAGTYAVKVRATDSEGSISAWSPALAVQIASTFESNPVSDNPPATPATLSGVISGSTSCTYSYSTVTADPDGDALSYTFCWGDGTFMTVPQSDSGVQVCTAHAWALPGTYFVRVMATDSEGTASGWSGSLAVTIVGSAPANASGTGGTAASGDATGSARVQTGDSSVGEANTAPDNANSGAAPMSPGHESVPSVGAHASGFVLCLLMVIVMVGSAVWLVGAIVRESTFKPARE